jgi:hypothetical protein
MKMQSVTETQFAALVWVWGAPAPMMLMTCARTGVAPVAPMTATASRAVPHMSPLWREQGRLSAPGFDPTGRRRLAKMCMAVPCF